MNKNLCIFNDKIQAGETNMTYKFGHLEDDKSPGGAILW